MIGGETETGADDTMAARLAGVTQDGDDPALSDARHRVHASLFGEAPARARRTIGRFVLLERLGAGAMGEVFAARDPELARRVALKLLHRDRLDSEAARARLLREAQAMARLSHPNVVTVYESGTHEGRVYIAMELVAGVDLRALFGGGPQPWRRVVEVYRDAARGLAAAHAVGLVHRDFKPENVMVGEDGRVRVLDFGVARAGEGLAPASESSMSGRGDLLARELTHTGVLLGTPAYMAPEQLTTGETSPRSDQFSFCVALYEGLHGRRPFAAESLRELIEAHRTEVRPPARSEVPRAVHAVVLRGLKADPSARFPSMDALAGALDRCLAAPRRRQRLLALGGLTGGALVAGYVVAGQAVTDPCAAGEAAIAAVWHPERAAALAEAFAGSGTPEAPQQWQKIAGRVDEYTRAWAEEHADACQAEKISGEQARRVAELRMACLSDARRELDETLEVLARAEPAVIFTGVQAIADLPPPSRCADSRALLAGVQPPADPAVAAQAAAIRGRAAEVRALRRAGLSSRAYEEVTRLAADAAAVDVAPLRAELDLLTGQLELDTARYEAAATTLERGFWTAIDSGHDEVAATAAVALAGLVGGRQAALEPGLGWARSAEALIRRAHLSGALGAALRRSRAQMLRVAGQPDRARAELDAALVAQRAAPTVDDLDAAGLLRELAGVALDQGRADEAAGLVEEALRHARAALGEHHPEVGRALRLLGTSLYSAGRREEALRTYEEARRIGELAHGPEHPDVGDAMNNIGATLDELGRDVEALAAYERALAIRRRNLGENHPSVAGTLDNMALTLKKLGRLEEAEQASRRVQAILRVVHGERHPEVAVNLLHLAELARERERFAEAAAQARQAVDMFTATLGPQHPDVAFALSDLAFILLDAGDAAAAIEPARRALELRSASEQPDPLLVAESQLRLGQALWLSGRDRAEGRALLRAARAGYAAQHNERLPGIDAWLAEQRIEPGP
ncbi:Serine/threonine protein kinase [Nannocystis exedens]|uniref:Serine/threonine protein kinase n=2 Tax=Nannocystis exedens TaxID=54 RepID=A0A1I2I9F3_9BACT|nr:serine/threonine-protein kinase [Nannocystis exedens]PCC70098.1 Serine/threonine-protein kinase PK-1 [Nannocystis exedens]SFF38864.1 Serine/threonine protein kinase [Nannocystis exedens]